jgi:hypothetical protein
VAKQYVVTAPYVTFKAKDQAGGTVLREMYQGGTLPDDAEPDNVERLLEKKMIAEVGSKEADLLGAPAGTPIPGEPPNVPVTEQSPAYVDQQARLQRASDAVEQADRSATRGRPGSKSTTSRSEPDSKSAAKSDPDAKSGG